MDTTASSPVTEALEALAGALDPVMYATTLTGGSQPHLTVTNREYPGLSDAICVQGGWYCWSWDKRIAPVMDPLCAAERVGTVIGAVSSGSGHV